MRYISVECEYFSAKFVPNPALLPELFLSEAMSIHSGGVDEQGKGQAPCNGHNEIGCKPSRNPTGSPHDDLLLYAALGDPKEFCNHISQSSERLSDMIR